MKKLLIATGLLLANYASAQTDYEAILAEYYSADGPGAAALVVKEGEVLYRGARGMADIELDVPLSADHVFRIASITKQFTTAAIMLLEQDGKLNISDPITEFLPEYPVHGHTITIEHLMSNTSGIFSYTDIEDYWNGPFMRSAVTPEELIEYFKNEPMRFAPGDAYNYSNSGFVILGVIIEKVSGMTYPEFIQQRIFEPLGMKDSYYGGRKIIDKKANGYSNEHDEVVNALSIDMGHPYSAGGLLSTVDDLRRWHEALYGYELLPKEAVDRMVTDFELNDGETTGYGYGIGVFDVMGVSTYGHSGGISGFTSNARWLPDEKIFVAVLVNTDMPDVSANFVAGRMSMDAAGVEYPSFTSIDLDEDVLAEYVGVYRINDHEVREVSLHDGELWSQRSGGGLFLMKPHAKDAFYYHGSFTHVTFDREDGEIVAMSMYPNGSEEADQAPLVDEEHSE